MIKAIIIDDELPARELLRKMLSRIPGNRIKVLADANGVESGKKAITEHKPDVVFLDIQMRDGTGIDLLTQLEGADFEVVFVTSYDKYAIQAFQLSAFGYMLKPIKMNELSTVIEKLEKRLTKIKTEANNRIKILIENYHDSGQVKKFIINHMKGFDVSPVKEILRLEGDGNYTKFILSNDRRILTSTTLGEYEDLLHAHGFYRIHQSTIVNLRHISKYIKGVGGEVVMSDGKSFSVSRYRKKGFLEEFNNYQ